MRACPSCSLISEDSAIRCGCGRAFDGAEQTAGHAASASLGPAVDLRPPGLMLKIAVGLVGYVVGGLAESFIELVVSDLQHAPATNRTVSAGIAGAILALGKLKYQRNSSGLPAAPNTVGRRNYFVRHWRGELPLGITYWRNGGLGALLASHLIQVTGYFLGLSEAKDLYLVGFAALWLIACLLGTWQLVGIWRASNWPARHGGLQDGAALAKFGAAVGALFWVVLFVSMGVPTFRAALDQERWLEANAHWEVRVLRDGAELEVSGGIGRGFAHDLQRALDVNPAVRVVHLNLGAGGLIAEAKSARELLRTRALSTYVSASCVSACTLVFLGGQRRFFKQGAKLGFHAPSAPGIDGYELTQFLGRERAYLISVGVSPEFAARVVATSSEMMWYPTAEELTSSGVVTEVTSGDSFAFSSGAKPPDLQRMRALLQQHRVYRALERSEPEVYAKILQVMYEGLSRGESMQEMSDRTGSLLTSSFKRALPHASDAALLRFGKLKVTELSELQRVDPEGCDRVLKGKTASTEEAARSFSAAMRSEELEVMADVIESQDHAREQPSLRDTKRLLSRALRQSVRAGRIDRRALASGGCPAAIAIYAAAADLPPTDGAALIRRDLAPR